MSAGVLASFETSPIGPAPIPFLNINLSVSVRAERRRLFQVLTVPEYMETWLSFPGLLSDSRVAVTSAPQYFRIDHFRARELDFTVIAGYRTCRRSKLQFSWHKESGYGSSSSEVDISLRGDFGRTTVALRHSLLSSRADHAWHRDFWEKSLQQLCLLFDSDIRRESRNHAPPGEV